MTVLTSTVDTGGFLAPEHAHLVLGPVEQAAVALQAPVATFVRTAANTWHAPVVDEDASAAWLTEGAEITTDEPVFDELIVVPRKVGGLVVLSRELADDSSPPAVEEIRRGLARSIAGKIDAAYFGALAAPAPSGLGALAGVATVDTGGSFTNLDVFAEAIADVEANLGHATAFVTNPADGLTLAKLKVATGSNLPLLGADPTQPTGRQILGRPLFVSPAVTSGTVWAVDRAASFVVVREDVTLDFSRDSHFTSDRVAVRATMRVGFGFPHPNRICRIYDVP